MRSRLSLVLPLLLAAASVLVASPARAATEADLAVTVGTPSAAYVGAVIDVTAALTNNGPSSAEGVVLTVTATGPATLFGAPGCVHESASRLVCQLGTMHHLSPVPPRQFQARADAPGTVTFTVEISSATTDPQPANNSDTTEVEVTSGGPADLNVHASGPASMTVGQPTNYAVQFGNNGPADATSVTLVSTVSPNLEIYDFAYPGCTSTTTEVTCSFSSVFAQTQGILLIRVRPVAAGPATISAQISSTDNADPNPANNGSAVTIPVTASADLGVSLAESTDPVKSRRDLVLTTTVTSSGPSSADGAVLREVFSGTGLQDLTIVSVRSSSGTCTTSADTVTCDFGSLAPGTTATVEVTVTPRGNGTVTTQADVSSSAPDPDTADNTATESTRVSPSGR